MYIITTQCAFGNFERDILIFIAFNIFKVWDYPLECMRKSARLLKLKECVSFLPRALEQVNFTGIGKIN